MMRAWCVVLLMTAVGLAGCSGDGDGDGGNNGGLKKVAGGRLDNIKEGEGALRGRVTDDVGFPLAGAKVALLGTTHIDLTQGNGTFLFTNITSGNHKLYVEHKDHHPLEDFVDVLSGELLEVEVVLLPLAARGAGYRPHIHDNWAGEPVKTVIDRTPFEYHEPYDDTGPYSEAFGRYYDTVTAGNVHPCVWTDSQDEVYFNNRLIWFDDPEQLVWAGTERIEVVIDWEATDYPYHEDFALAWAGANSSTYEESPLIKKGEPFFIDVDPTQWDSSHQSYSLWEIWVCLDTASDQDVPRLFLGSFTATVKLHRMEGPIPFETAHPTFWPESGQMTVVSGDEPTTISSTYSLSRSTFNSQFVVRPDEGLVVPPGTKYLSARLEWSYGGTTIEAKPWSLTYRPANERFWDMKDPGELLMGDLDEHGTGYRVYIIELEPAHTDQFYQKKSNWYFMLNLEGEEDDWKYVSPCGGCAVELTLTVTAHQRSDFQEG